MGKNIFIGITTILVSIYASWAQETELPELNLEIKPFEALIIPLSTNITLYNSGISLQPTGGLMLDIKDFIPINAKPLSGWDLMRWQKDFVKDNNLKKIPYDATLSNPNVMAYLLADKNQMNQELYYNYVLMNQRNVGNTQLQRMNVRMRGVPYVDFTAFGKLLDFYIIGDPVPLAAPSTMHLNNIR